MKPISISTKDWLIQGTSQELKQEEELVNTVISWSYLKAKEALKTSNSVEISGFGKFILSPSKMKRRIRVRNSHLTKYTNKLNRITDEAHIENIMKDMQKLRDEIIWLETKIKQNEPGSN